MDPSTVKIKTEVKVDSSKTLGGIAKPKFAPKAPPKRSEAEIEAAAKLLQEKEAKARYSQFCIM